MLALLSGGLVSSTAWAEDNVLLVQTGPTGFTVWHTEGRSQMPDDDVLEIMASALPDGGEVISSPLGAARAYELSAGIRIELQEAKVDRALLVDRDACGHIRVWHAEGTTRLPDDMLTDIVMSALPEGGPRLRFGDRYAKGFIGKLGVTISLWQVPGSK